MFGRRLAQKIRLLRDLVNYTILGEESRVEELVASALEAGARREGDSGSSPPGEPGELIELSEVEKASTYRHR